MKPQTRNILIGAAVVAIIVLAAVGIVFWPQGGAGPVPGTKPAASVPAALPAEVDVSTEAIKNGRVKMADVNSASLLHMLNDLKERAANDRAEHGGNPGPVAAHLEE